MLILRIDLVQLGNYLYWLITNSFDIDTQRIELRNINIIIIIIKEMHVVLINRLGIEKMRDLTRKELHNLTFTKVDWLSVEKKKKLYTERDIFR